MTNPMRDALEAAKEAILWWQHEHGCCKGATDDALAKIDAALSAVPAPVSEEEIARTMLAHIETTRGMWQFCEDLQHWPEQALSGLARAILSRLSRTEGEWRPDPKTVEMCAKVADDAISDELDWDTSYWNQCCEQIAAAIRSLHPAEKE